MLATLHIAGLGPHRTTEIVVPEPFGHTTFAGHSMAGKSSILHAVLFGLFGRAPGGREFPVELIGDGFDRAEVSLVAASGTVLRRTMTAKRSTTRTVERNGALTACATESQFGAQLGPVGERPDVAQLVITPMAWRPLVEEKLGRPLRDLVASILPGADVRAVVEGLMSQAGHTLRASDPTDEAGAARAQTAANAAAAAADERLSGAKRRATDAHARVSGPSVEAVKLAESTLAIVAEWERHDRAAELYAADERARGRQIEARDRYRATRTQLGERPTYDAAAVQAAEQAVDALEARIAEAKAERERAAKDYREATAALEAQRGATVCPTCGHSLEEPLDTRELAARVASAEKAGGEARRALDEGTAQLVTARRTLADVGQARDRAREWDAAVRALGAEPAVDASRPTPTEPTTPAVEPAAIDAARRTLDAAKAAAGATARAEEEQSRAQRELADAMAGAERAGAERERIKALVACVRRAPSAIAEAQSEALGDLGPVALRFPPKTSSTTPEIEVLVDGRPWWTASDGRLVLADLYLRAAIRRLAGLDALPIIVDRAQDWSGEWPEIEGPVWYLVTRAGELLVRDGAPRAEAA